MRGHFCSSHFAAWDGTTASILTLGIRPVLTAASPLSSHAIFMAGVSAASMAMAVATYIAQRDSMCTAIVLQLRIVPHIVTNGSDMNGQEVLVIARGALTTIRGSTVNLGDGAESAGMQTCRAERAQTCRALRVRTADFLRAIPMGSRCLRLW